MANPFVHVELATTDLDKAKSFYQLLFDCQGQVARRHGDARGHRSAERGFVLDHHRPDRRDARALATKSKVKMRARLTLPEAGSGPGLVLLAEADRDTRALADLY